MEEKKEKAKKGQKTLRVGNFIVRMHTENDIPVYYHIKAASAVWEMFLNDATSDVFQMVTMSFNEEQLLKWLEMYIVGCYVVCSNPVDAEFIDDLVSCYEKYLERNAASSYGINTDITKKEDDKIIKEMKDIENAVEDLFKDERR